VLERHSSRREVAPQLVLGGAMDRVEQTPSTGVILRDLVPKDMACIAMGSPGF
jgi:hypothetical protein